MDTSTLVITVIVIVVVWFIAGYAAAWGSIPGKENNIQLNWKNVKLLVGGPISLTCVVVSRLLDILPTID